MTPLHPGAQPKCPQCHGLAVCVTKEGERAIATQCPCVACCPRCGDTGWVRHGTDRTSPKRRCTCQGLARRLELFNRTGIPARHAESALSSFKPSRPQMEAFKRVATFLHGYKPGIPQRGLVLWGDVGRGKTHLMIAMARDLVLRHGVSVRFVEFSHLLADLKRGFDRKEGTGRLIDPLVAVDVLCIDEMGKGRNTDFEGTVLDELISRRYNAEGPILATTNYAPRPATGTRTANLALSPERRTDPTLEDRVGARVYSRLWEMCDFAELPGADFRVSKHYRAH